MGLGKGDIRIIFHRWQEEPGLTLHAYCFKGGASKGSGQEERQRFSTDLTWKNLYQHVAIAFGQIYWPMEIIYGMG